MFVVCECHLTNMLRFSFCSHCTLVWYQGPHVFVLKHFEHFGLNTLLTHTFTIFVCQSMFLAMKQPKRYILYGSDGHPFFLIHLSSCHGKLCYFAEMQHDVTGAYVVLGHWVLLFCSSLHSLWQSKNFCSLLQFSLFSM